MRRRELFGAGAAAFMAQRHLAAQEKVERATRALPSPKIKDVQVIALTFGCPGKLTLKPSGMFWYSSQSWAETEPPAR